MSDSNIVYRLPSMDGLRACAIAFVVLGHAADASGWPLLGTAFERAIDPVLLNGVLGVRIFFVISGFLITTLLTREERRTGDVSLKAFYVRRALRILPVLLVYIGVVALYEQAIGRHVLLPYINALTFTTGGFFPDVKTRVLAHTWSLSVEEHFYLAWPLVFAVLGARGRVATALSIVAVAPFVRAAAYLGHRPNLTFQTILGNMDLLMVGCLVALGFAYRPARIIKLVHVRPGIGRFVAIAVLFGVQWIEGRNTAWFTVPLKPACEALCVAYLIASLITIREGALYRALNFAPVAWVGVLSYSLYVWQQLIVYQGGDGYDAFPFQVWPVSIALLAIVAPLSYYGIERPFLRLKDRWAAKHTTRAPSAAAVPAE